MRLLLVVSEMGVGGAERVVVDLAADAVARGDRVAVLAAPGPFDADIEQLPIERASLPTGRSPREVAGALAAAARLAHRFRPDLVHAHNVRVTGVARLGTQLPRPLRRPPLVATYHGVPADEVAMAARVLRLADTVLCVSAGLRDQLAGAGVPARRLAVIPNGVAAAEPLSAADRERLDAELGLGDGPVVSIVGRLAPQKAHDRFLAAAALVSARVPDARFLVVGDGPARAASETEATRLGLEDVVTFTGVRLDAPRVIARSDVLVFSSDWEGLSIAALEGLAAGVPVVSTDVAGMRELLSTGAGLVVAHDARALAEAIEAVVTDADRRAVMSAEAHRVHATGFSTDTMIARHRDAYDRLLAPR